MGDRARGEQEALKERLVELLAGCESKRSHLIPILQKVQDVFGDDLDIYLAVDSILSRIRPS